MKKYPDFFSVLVGPTPGFFLGYIVVAFICAGAIVLYDIGKRDVSSPRTPKDFNIKFWLADNLARVMANFILIPIAIRLCYQYVNPTWMLALSCGIGFGIDGLGMIAKNSGILTTGKLAQRIKDNIEKV